MTSSKTCRECRHSKITEFDGCKLEEAARRSQWYDVYWKWREEYIEKHTKIDSKGESFIEAHDLIAMAQECPQYDPQN